MLDFFRFTRLECSYVPPIRVDYTFSLVPDKHMRSFNRAK